MQRRRLVQARNDVYGFDALIGIAAKVQARKAVDQVDDLDDLARYQLPGRDVGLQSSLGSSASKLISEHLGRF